MSLPTGVVTFLFTDIEGSGRLLERHGQRLIEAIADHQQRLAAIVSDAGGVVFETVGDAAYAAFADPVAAVTAAMGVQRRVARGDAHGVGEMRVRMALHRGPVERRGAHYMGSALFRAARVVALAHGGQTLATSDIVEACAPGGPHGFAFRDLGRQRLRDVRQPERVWQVDAPGLPSAFPPLRSVDVRLDDLPRSRTSFVGREADLEGVLERLAVDRLVTLTGPGGMGKTRLAVEAAHAALARQAERFDDGAVMVDLTSARVPDDVPGAIAAAIHVRPADDEPTEAALGRWLADRRLLLLLDNCEHVIEMAPLVGRLLDHADGLVVLATSRERLRLRDERVVEVPPLRTSRAAEPMGAVRLFCDRAGIDAAGLTRAEVDAVAEVCERLDGLPLAIELAAARMHPGADLDAVAPVGERLDRLRHGPRDLPQRHQALGAAIDWSVALLSADERALFGRVGVFARGWTGEAAEDVCGPLPQGAAVADALASLVEQSLVRRTRSGGHERFSMLETIREASVARLDASAEAAAIRDRHLAWAVGFMAAAEAGRWGSDPGTWVGRVRDEAPGIDDAMRHAAATGDQRALAVVAGGVVAQPELLSTRPVMVREWVRLAVDGLAVRPDVVPARDQARVHMTDAVLAYYDGDHPGALARLAVARALLEPLGPSDALGEVMLFQAEVTTDVAPDDPGRHDALVRGLRILDATEAVDEAAGYHVGVGSVANSRAIILGDLGKTDEALAEFGRAIALLDAANPGGDVNVVVISQAMVELQAALTDRASVTIRRCLDWRRTTGVPDPWIDAFTLLVVAGIAVERSEFATAGRLVGVALQLQARSGQRTRAWDATLTETRIALDAASGGLAEGLIALGATLAPDEAFELAGLVVRLGPAA